MPGLSDHRAELGVLVDQIPLTYGNPLEVLGQGVRGEQAGMGTADHHGMAPTWPRSTPLEKSHLQCHLYSNRTRWRRGYR